jgi:hypothetical protein
MSRYNLSEFIESKRAGRQTEIELPDGSTIRVDPIDLWSDDALTLSQTDPVKAAKTILGEDVYTGNAPTRARSSPRHGRSRTRGQRQQWRSRRNSSSGSLPCKPRPSVPGNDNNNRMGADLWLL